MAGDGRDYVCHHAGVEHIETEVVTLTPPFEAFELIPLLLCCCLPTLMTLASGGSLMFPLVVHQPASLASSAVLCTSCGSSQCCVLHDLQFVNAGRGCNRRPYRRGILQSRSHNCFIGSHECLLLFTPSCCSECFYDF